MIVARMREEHLPGVKELLDGCFPDAWSMENLRGELEKNDTVCVIALDGERIAAFLAFEKILDTGTVTEIAVRPDFRRQGIAEYLLKLVMDAFDDLSEVTLEVRASNAPAIGLYRKLGFQKIGVRKNYYSRPTEDAWIMTKTIGDMI